MKQPSRQPVLVRKEKSRTLNSTSTSQGVQQRHHHGDQQNRHNEESQELRPHNGDVQLNRYYKEVQETRYSREIVGYIPTVNDFPVRESNTNEPIDLEDLVEDELENEVEVDMVGEVSWVGELDEVGEVSEIDDYLDENESIYRGRPISRSPRQPVPLRWKPGPKNPHKQPSECSLVKRITNVAETMQITGNSDQEHEESSAPQIEEASATQVARWRPDAPIPIIAPMRHRLRTLTSVPPPRKPEPSPALRSAPATSFIRTKSSMDSLRSPGIGPRRRPSRDSVPIPPPRSAGLHSFNERGVPSAAFVEEENSEEEHQHPDTPYLSPSMLVSISRPSPTYSCAVQACYCNPEDTEDCPSCRERRRLETELSMKWI